MTDAITTENGLERNAELQAVQMMLDKLDVPEALTLHHEYDGKPYEITIKRLGLNPAMALKVFRTYGFTGIQHSAPTVYFWNAIGAPKTVCDDFKQRYGDRIFDMVQHYMKEQQAIRLQ